MLRAACRLRYWTGRAALPPNLGLPSPMSLLWGGLRLPDDETGDCFKFTNALAGMAAARGVRFQFDTAIEAIEADAGGVISVRTNCGPVTADRYVVALGSFSPARVGCSASGCRSIP